MGTPTKKSETKDAGRRLREFRFGLAEFKEAPRFKTLRTFAEETGVDEDNLSNWERGVSLVATEYVARLKDKFGVSFLFEWIYGGDDSGLSDRLRTAIRGQHKPAIKVVPKPEQKRRRA